MTMTLGWAPTAKQEKSKVEMNRLMRGNEFNLRVGLTMKKIGADLSRDPNKGSRFKAAPTEFEAKQGYAINSGIS